MNSKRDISLPELYKLWAEARETLRELKDIIATDPANPMAFILLQDVRDVILELKKQDERVFQKNVEELGSNIGEYPHAVQTWYFDEFLPEFLSD
jgi:hypothetical protein